MTTNSSKTSSSNSSIKNEEQLQDAIKHEQEKIAPTLQNERFAELEKVLHETLGRQDSENALTLITK